MVYGITVIQILVVLLWIFCGFGLATQYAAHILEYAPELTGAPWFIILGYPVYSPFAFVAWSFRLGDNTPPAFQYALFGVYAGVLLAVFSAMLCAKMKTAYTKQRTMYGSARWATQREIKAMKLLQPKGVILGMNAARQLLRHDGPEHICVFAPTRSGKGVGIVIPTLLSWTGSVVVHDIKGENWHLTSGWRAQFSRCIYFNPTNPDGACFNPLLEIRKGKHEVRDAQTIADILVDPEGTDARRDHWEKTSHSLLVGAILHVLYAEEDKTLSGVAYFLSNPDCGLIKTLKRMLATKHLEDKPHPVIAAIAREMLNKSENELSGVFSTALGYLGLYRDAIIAKATRKSDFAIADLIKYEQPVSLYLVVPPSDIQRTRPLMRLILNQMCRLLTEQYDKGHLSDVKRLLLLIDEFPSLGKLDFFETSLSYMAGYGIKVMLICQSLNQLDFYYGERNAILENCHVRIAFATNDDRTAKRISDLLGQGTVANEHVSLMGNRLGLWLRNVSLSEQWIGRPLLTPGEIGTLPDNDAIILLSGCHPVYAHKLKYYKERCFARRVLPAVQPEIQQSQENSIFTLWEQEGKKQMDEQLLENQEIHINYDSDMVELADIYEAVDDDDNDDDDDEEEKQKNMTVATHEKGLAI